MFEEKIQSTIKVAPPREGVSMVDAAKATGSQIARFFEQHNLKNGYDCSLTALNGKDSFAQAVYTIQVADRILKEENRELISTFRSYTDGEKHGFYFNLKTMYYSSNEKFRNFKTDKFFSFKGEPVEEMLNTYYKKVGSFCFVPFRELRSGYNFYVGPYIGGGTIDLAEENNFVKIENTLEKIKFIEKMSSGEIVNNNLCFGDYAKILYFIYKANCYDNSAFALDFNPEKFKGVAIRQKLIKRI
jgi:hypothetical protein